MQSAEWHKGRLADAAQQYRKATDLDVRGSMAKVIFAMSIEALRDLGMFANVDVEEPFIALLLAFATLDEGRTHPWLSPRPTGGTNSETAISRELRRWAIARIAYQVSTLGVSARAAAQSTHALISASGHACSFETVRRWWKSASTDDKAREYVGDGLVGHFAVFR